jgi:hypothetical protein
LKVIGFAMLGAAVDVGRRAAGGVIEKTNPSPPGPRDPAGVWFST